MKSASSFAKKTAVAITLILGCSQVSNGLITSSRPLTHGISSPASAFHTSYSKNSKTSLASSSQEQGDDNALYSFGAEVVPEGQRPVNEYLDMKQAPLFGWGSNEVGLQGLLIRLGIVYAVIFAVM